MARCFLVSDLHGKKFLYHILFKRISIDAPEMVFIAGDILPHALMQENPMGGSFIKDWFIPELKKLKILMKDTYPAIFIILGNDDAKIFVPDLLDGQEKGLFHYAHNRRFTFGKYDIYGYSYVPPTPFRLKDWEKYDVSRYAAPGCIHPDEGARSVDVPLNKIQYSTIKDDLDNLAGSPDLGDSIFMFHTPPYNTGLDIAALEGKKIDEAPLDPHVGSIAVERFIKKRKPMLTMHGHIHESARLSGRWKEKIGETWAYQAAHDGRGLALIIFDTANPEEAAREIISK